MVLTLALAACETAAPAEPGPAASTPPSSAPSASGSPAATPTPEPPPAAAVAFLQDLSPEGALEPLLPVYRAVELAFAAASIDPEDPVDVELTSFDTAGDAEVAGEIAADPRYVAAIAAPDLPGQAELVSRFAAAGVPVLSLSARGSPEAPPAGAWLRLVAPVPTLGGALAETAASLRRVEDGVCIVEAPTDGTVLGRVAARSLPPDLDLTEVSGPVEVGEAGCGVVLWAGGGVDGAELAASLAAIEPHPPVLVGGPALLDPRFLVLAEDPHAVAVCSCVDLSTSLDLEAQRFIQDFQTEYGRPPGAYVVEAWDAAQLVLAALRGGGQDRASVWDRIASTTAIDGLGGPYTLAAGELADPRSFVRVYRVRGGRWGEVSSASNT